jgi:hypothetical protein
MTLEPNPRPAGVQIDQRRVWLKAFWGFKPEDDGYIGFTKEAHRDRLLRDYRDGDLVLIYGADQAETARDDRRQLLGFLEVDPIPVTDKERSSPEGYRRKVENGWQDRWTYALPVRRAWRVNRRVEVGHLTGQTYQPNMARVIASRGELLTPAEVTAVLGLPVTPAQVFGEPPLHPDEMRGEAAIGDLFRPSAGVTPTYGTRNFTIEDGENHLYVLKLQGDVATFLGRQKYEVLKKCVVKVGHAKEPQERCDTHNIHLPPASQFKWHLAYTSKPFPTGTAAKEAEDGLKQHFEKRFESLGREFFLVDEHAIATEFTTSVEALAFKIVAVPSS